MPTWGVLKDGWEPAKESEGEKGFFGEKNGQPHEGQEAGESSLCPGDSGSG